MTKIIAVNEKNDWIRAKFFKAVFGDYNGYVAVAAKKDEEFTSEFFLYPDQLSDVLRWVNENYSDSNLYFCPQLLAHPKRVKENVETCPVLWADLDEVDPHRVAPHPSIAVESSTARWQAYWILNDPDKPKVVEAANRRLTYDIGADTSGWDLTQLLRVPLTYNFKHGQEIVRILWIEEDTKLSMEDTEKFPEPSTPLAKADEQFPKEEIDNLPDAKEIILDFRFRLPNSFHNMYTNTQADDRSSIMWAIESICFEAGMTSEQTFKVVSESPVNKYKQDGRDPIDLWKEIIKAKLAIRTRIEYKEAFRIEPLLTDEERASVQKLPNTFVEDYVEWGKSRTDAAPGYHEAGAFIILSAILSESLELPMSFGKVRPNLWFMILGDTTLTRKTTAMEMALETLGLVKSDYLLATDGSVEGIMTALSLRTGRTSVFARDEISGLIHAMQRKDYLSGLVEGFSRWYEGKTDVRMLKKEKIEVRDPRFIMFCGGIKSRMMELLDREYVINGFIPRFLFVTAISDPQKYQPPTMMDDSMSTISGHLVGYLSKLHDRFDVEMTMKLGEQEFTKPKTWILDMTPEALERYADFERTMTLSGAVATEPELYSPTLDRMAKSGLKIAMMFAAMRDMESEKITIQLEDMLRAINYIDQWKQYTFDIIENVGKGSNERQLERAFVLVKKGKDTRSEIMRSMHLTSKEAEWIFETLEQRGLITRSKYGKLEKIYATSV